jgi:5'-nucleotidase
MPRPMGKIHIMMSASVLFDMEEANSIFKEKGEKEYTDYMLGLGKYAKDYDPKLGGRALKQGPLWSFAQAALALNKPGQPPVVEIGLMTKDTEDTAVPIFRNLDVGPLRNIGYRVATAGNKLDMAEHEIFGTDLLLTQNAEDVQQAVNHDIAAAVINPPPPGVHYDRAPGGPLQLSFDGDAVSVGGSAELVYRKGGLAEYRKHESENFDKPMERGPFTSFLAKVTEMNSHYARDEQPIRLSLLTARGSDAGARMIAAAEKLGIDFNGGQHFMDGMAKAPVIKAEKPDLFFDDQMVHLQDSKQYAPTGLVAYKEGSPMDLFLKEEAKKQAALAVTAAAVKPVQDNIAKKAAVKQKLSH